jgi:hypothetical protein
MNDWLSFISTTTPLNSETLGGYGVPVVELRLQK